MILAPALLVASFAAACLPAFPYKDGWLGGDAAYSVETSPGRSIWLFGDTFVGGRRAKTRAGAKMIANSVAVSRCADGRWSLEYRWRKNILGSPRAFFEYGPAGEKLWPQDAFMSGGRLYLALSRVQSDPKDALGFKLASVVLARVDNPGDEPRRWRVSYRSLWADGVAFPGAAAVVDGAYVYLFTPRDDAAHKDHPMLLARLALDALDAPAPPLEYRAKDGSWKKGLAPEDAAVVMNRGATEMSVRRHPSGAGWLAVQPGGFADAQAYARAAPDLTGPWSDPRPILRYQTNDDKAFCYAAKEHAQFQRADGIVVTYACNTLDFSRLVSDMALYVPRAAVVPIEALPPPPAIR